MIEILNDVKEAVKESIKYHTHKWEVRATIWPYKEGYGTICPSCDTIFDTGLTKTEAKASAKAMNAAKLKIERKKNKGASSNLSINVIVINP